MVYCTQHSGDLTAEKLDQIWRTFGQELTADDPIYKSTSALDWRQERDRQEEAQGMSSYHHLHTYHHKV